MSAGVTDDIVASLRGDPRVDIVTSPSDTALADLYAHARALVYPSRMEGFGLPVAEAMAIGCPVVASALPAIKGFAGEIPAYAPPGDVDALREAIQRVLDQPAEAEARARSGIPVARSLRWEATAERDRPSNRRCHDVGILPRWHDCEILATSRRRPRATTFSCRPHSWHWNDGTG